MRAIRTRLYNLLRWSQRYTRTDMVYLAKGGTWLSLAQGVATLAGLALAVALANLIPPEVYGQYKYITAAAAIVGAFTLTGLNSSIIQSVARGFEGAFAEGVRTMFTWSAGIVVVALAAAGYYAYQENFTLALSFLIIGMAVPVISSLSLYQGFLNGKKDFKTKAILSSVRRIVVVAATVSTVLFTQNPVLIVAAYFGSEALMALALYSYVRWRYQPGDAREQGSVAFSKHLSVMNILKMIGNRFDQILVFQQLGAVQLATYAFALAPIKELQTIDRTIAGIAYPKLSERSLPELQRTLPRKVFLLSLAMLAVALCYIALAPHLFNLVFPQYLEAIQYTQALAILLVFAPQALYKKALTAHRRTHSLYMYDVSLPVLRISLGIPLLLLFNLWGVIIARIASNAVSFFILHTLFMSKERGTPSTNLAEDDSISV